MRLTPNTYRPIMAQHPPVLATMDITVLGTSAVYPEQGKACSGYIVQEGETKLLLDCGTGVFHNLRAHSSLDDLTAVVISHLHPDHFLDLLPLRQVIHFEPRLHGYRPPLYLPPGGLDTLARFMDVLRPPQQPVAPFLSRFEGREYDPASPLAFGTLRLEFASVKHPIPTYAVAVTSGARFVYSADSAPCPSLMELARDADLFLCETTFLGDEPNLVPGVHFTAEEVGAFARDANVRQLSVTHVLPGTSRERISALASRDFGAPVPVVEEHQVLHL